MSHALYDPATGKATEITLPREGWPLALPKKAKKRGTRVLRKLRDKPEKLHLFAPTEADAIAGRYIVPVYDLPKPDPGPLDGLEFTDAYDEPTDSVVRTWKVKPATRLELRRRLFIEGRELLRQTNWTQTADYSSCYPVEAAAWDAWRHVVRSTMKELKAGTRDPRTVTWNDPPEPLEDIIE